MMRQLLGVLAIFAISKSMIYGGAWNKRQELLFWCKGSLTQERIFFLFWQLKRVLECQTKLKRGE